ncbi:MAG: hypothetical protein V4584_08140 [Verrucomicrobiota bacterium]
MKTKLTTLLLALTAGFAFGHGDIEIGPNKGRILEFSTNESMHGEVTAKDGKLHIAVLDKDMKPVKVEAQSLVITGGTREKPVKLEVTKVADGFTLAEPAPGELIIMQYKETADAKAITARLNYNTKKCEPCGNPEWRCACDAKK